MKYENLKINNKEEVELLLNETNDREIISKLIVGSINSINDSLWLEKLLIRLLKNNDFWIIKNSINGLSDLIRIYGRLDCINEINEILNKIYINKPEMIPYIEEFRDDEEVFKNG